MKTPAVLALCLLTAAAALAAPTAARAAEPTRRFAIVAGAREGGPGRTALRYSTTDAREVSQVLRALGGVAPADVALLEDPSPAALRAAIATVSRTAAEVKARGGRSELFLYYSGHSDAEGLLLGNERLPYKDLRGELDRTPAEVRVAILDSCASGAFTREKGGVHRPPFLLDASQRLRGHAFLTSSAADEASQESDKIKASFFTHALLTGMRGAADANGDGRVTLNEAYQFAFHETLAQTEGTRAGPQHATYDIGLVGSGDVVLTDLRLAGAALVLPEVLEGRVFVRDAGGVLMAELRKVKGTPVELALPPGDYQVRIARGDRVDAGTFAVPGNGRVVVVQEKLAAAVAEVNAVRGDVAAAGGEPAASIAPTVSVVDTTGRPPSRDVLFDVALVPPLSVNDAAGRPARNKLALGLLWSHSDVLDGIAVGGIGHSASAGGGVQVGGAAVWMGGPTKAIQVAGAFTGAGPLEGVQVSGAVAWASGTSEAIQVAGAVAGIAGGDAQAIQVAGAVASVAGRLEGVQVSGAVAYAGALRGLQVSPVNVVTGGVSGLQVGVVNVGGKVSGAQIGVINFSDDVDLPIGVINIVKEGRQVLEVYATETNPGGNVALKLGNRWFHTILAIGLDAGKHAGEVRWLPSFGVGVHTELLPRLSLDVDALSGSVQYGPATDTGTRELSTLRASFAWQLAPRFAVFAAPAVNVFTVDAGQHEDVKFLGSVSLHEGAKRDVRLFPGFAVGVRI
ncbi:MAG: caspase family protein [Anaeromyxobacteraceae bacterium]